MKEKEIFSKILSLLERIHYILYDDIVLKKQRCDLYKLEDEIEQLRSSLVKIYGERNETN